MQEIKKREPNGEANTERLIAAKRRSTKAYKAYHGRKEKARNILWGSSLLIIFGTACALEGLADMGAKGILMIFLLATLAGALCFIGERCGEG